MREVFGYDIPSETTGECWAISAHSNGDCICTTKGFEGLRLSELWEKYPELFGNCSGKAFPLLLKVIDAKEDLSIQVHPDDEYAGKNENGSYGKTECWYVLDCDEDSKLVIGHNAGTREELCKLIDSNRYSELIRFVPVKKGDFIQINPGTVHAIKGGLMILETQQNSDITYRVYDYDRLMDGKLRQLHVEQSKAVISVPSEGGEVKHTSDNPGTERLIECKYYAVDKLNVEGTLEIAGEDSFRMVSCIEGDGTVNGMHIHNGIHFIVPAEYGNMALSGKMTLIVSTPGKAE